MRAMQAKRRDACLAAFEEQAIVVDAVVLALGAMNAFAQLGVLTAVGFRA